MYKTVVIFLFSLIFGSSHTLSAYFACSMGLFFVLLAALLRHLLRHFHRHVPRHLLRYFLADNACLSCIPCPSCIAYFQCFLVLLFSLFPCFGFWFTCLHIIYSRLVPLLFLIYFFLASLFSFLNFLFIQRIA